jgi:hypothetical protein
LFPPNNEPIGISPSMNSLDIGFNAPNIGPSLNFDEPWTSMENNMDWVSTLNP